MPFEQPFARSEQSVRDRASNGRRISRDSVTHPSLSVLARRLQYRRRIPSAKRKSWLASNTSQLSGFYVLRQLSTDDSSDDDGGGDSSGAHCSMTAQNNSRS